MKTTSKTEKTFDTVKVFREIKEKIAKVTEKMTASSQSPKTLGASVKRPYNQ